MHKLRSSGIGRRAAIRRLVSLAGGTVLAAPLLGRVKPALAEGEGNVIRVEEDWYVKIGVPEPGEDSPQITTVLAPSWATSGNLGIFDLNCATQPNFSSGGVQLQLWYNGAMIQARSNTNWDSIHYEGEEICYTSAMSLANGQISFEIINGTSNTWGAFGTGELKLQNASWRNNLNAYDPNCSVTNSRVGFASHRVRSFVLQRIRYYSQNGLKSTDDTPRVLHQYDPVT